MRLFKRKIEVVKVEGFKPSSEDSIFDVNLSFLRSSFKKLFETSDAVYGLNGEGVFRFKKSNFVPTILKAHSISFMPETTVIFTDFEGLCELAYHYETEIFETEKEFLIAYPGILWRAKKGDVKV